jgi:hypothetical protein
MLAAITCYFNPIEHENILRNYWMFREDLKGVDLFTIELSFNGNFEIEDAIHVEGEPQHIMWQKERLLNLLVKRLPIKYDKVAWLDADILFNNKKWAKQAERRLDRFPVLQLFEKALMTNAELDPVSEVTGLVYEPEGSEITSGLAWAAQRDILEDIGLVDTFITGGGDRMIYHAANGFFNNYYLTRTNIEWRQSYLKWAAKFYQRVQGKINCVEGEIIHLHHGTYADRQHTERWLTLSRHAYDPEKDIRINENGIWEWTGNNPVLQDAVADYFDERKEDEMWIREMKEKETSQDQRNTPETPPEPSSKPSSSHSETTSDQYTDGPPPPAAQ